MAATRRTTLLAALLSLAAPLLRAESSTSKTLEAKVALEASLERRVQSVLSEVLGSNDVVVIISVDIVPEEERVAVDQGGEVLPGVPIKEASQVPSALRSTLTMVRRVTTTIVVDNSTSAENLAVIKKVTSDLLGLSEARGDSLSVEKMAFHKPPKETFDWKDLLHPPLIWTPIWMALALIGLVTVLTGFMRPLIGVGRELPGAVRSLADAVKESGKEERAEGPGAPGAPIPGAAGAAAAAANGHKENGHKDTLPFGFIRPAHIPRLIYMLRKDTPENIAVVVHYLSSDNASKVLGGLDLKVRSQVAAKLGSVAELDPAKVKFIEERIKTKVEYIIGGEDRLLEIMDRSDEATQEAVLAELSAKNKALSDKLRGLIVRFADLETLEAKELQAVIKRAGIPLMAGVLKGEPELWAALKPRLAEGTAQRLAEEIDLSRPLPAETLEANKRQIVDIVKQLAREGWIQLHKEGPEEAS